MGLRSIAQRWLPRGNTLSDGEWLSRHRLIVRVTSFHVPVLALIGAANGHGFFHSVGDLSIIVGFLVAAWCTRSRWAKAVLASLALTTASALLVHLTGGLIESHFHYFAALPLLALYADWRPFGAAIVYVLVHHGVMGTLRPTGVYNHQAAIDKPLLWGAIHAGYVALLSIVLVIHWRFSEDQQELTMRAVHRLEEALESKDELIAGVSHELRTPLTGILGIATELAAHPGLFDPEEQRELLSSVAAEAQDLSNIVEDLLVSARARAGTLTVLLDEIDVSAVTISLLESATFRGYAIVSAIDREVWATADPVRVRQVIRNLLTNAQRHGGPDVQLVVARTSDGRPCVEVSDDGPGIDPEALIFEPYVSLAAAETMPKSIGLGLAVSAMLAESMGGSLRFERRGERTVFVFELRPPIGAASRRQSNASTTV